MPARGQRTNRQWITCTCWFIDNPAEADKVLYTYLSPEEYDFVAAPSETKRVDFDRRKAKMR